MITSVSWLLPSFGKDEVVQSNEAETFSWKNYATLFALGYSSL